uniref:Reverse transcriptase domain-containing protein n=1 Tax=Triticum urartu TaxID=4572 RepID=A0A8R7UEB0_TRIUA
MVQCCHRRRAPTMVLKLDFAKAFDSINWASLRAVMEVRGFPSLWCDWMDALFHSLSSAVLLNGVPGRWFQVRCGLRQGDPISYLFLLVADVLQWLIRQDEVLRHPLLLDAPVVVLQYADDTLIIARATEGGAVRLRQILDQFAAATGLIINF